MDLQPPLGDAVSVHYSSTDARPALCPLRAHVCFCKRNVQGLGSRGQSSAWRPLPLTTLPHSPAATRGCSLPSRTPSCFLALMRHTAHLSQGVRSSEHTYLPAVFPRSPDWGWCAGPSWWDQPCLFLQALG